MSPEVYNCASVLVRGEAVTDPVVAAGLMDEMLNWSVETRFENDQDSPCDAHAV